MNTNYSQYKALSEHDQRVYNVLNGLDTQYKTPEVKACIEEVMTDVVSDIESIKEVIFKPVIVKPEGK